MKKPFKYYAVKWADNAGAMLLFAYFAVLTAVLVVTYDWWVYAMFGVAAAVYLFGMLPLKKIKAWLAREYSDALFCMTGVCVASRGGEASVEIYSYPIAKCDAIDVAALSDGFKDFVAERPIGRERGGYPHVYLVAAKACPICGGRCGVGGFVLVSSADVGDLLRFDSRISVHGITVPMEMTVNTVVAADYGGEVVGGEFAGQFPTLGEGDHKVLFIPTHAEDARYYF